MEEYKFERAREAIEDLSPEQRDALLYLLLTEGGPSWSDDIELEFVFDAPPEPTGEKIDAAIPDSISADFGEEYFDRDAYRWAESMYDRFAQRGPFESREVQHFYELLKGALGLFYHTEMSSDVAAAVFDFVRRLWHDCVPTNAKAKVLSSNADSSPTGEGAC